MPKRYVRKRSRKSSTKVILTKVKRMISSNAEKKFLVVSNSNITSVLTQAVPYLALINGMVQGTTDNTRIGDRVKNLKFNCRLNIYGPAGLQVQIRIFIFKVKDPKGSAPTVTQLFNTASPNNISHANFQTVDWTNRFSLVASRECKLVAQYSTQQGTSMCEMNVPINSITDYSIGNAGTVADIDKNAYYMCIVSDSANATNVYEDSYWWYSDM